MGEDIVDYVLTLSVCYLLLLFCFTMWLDHYIESVSSNDGARLAANKKDMLYSLFAASSPTFTSSMPHDFLPLMPILAEMAFH